MPRKTIGALALGLGISVGLGACGDDAASDDGGAALADAAIGTDSAVTETDGALASDAAPADATPVDDGGEANPVDASGTTPTDASSGADTATLPPEPLTCFESINGIVVIEAETLPIFDAWDIGSDPEASGGQYIEWTDRSRNQDSGFGRFEFTVRLADAGLHRLTWHTRIGRGNDPTEHNDAWVRFPDVDEFYAFDNDDEADRVYPDPQCNDSAFMDPIRALPEVDSADCPEGSSDDGYFKIYSSGARDWRWSAFTNDRNAHTVVVRVNQPGDYTMQMAARADFSRIDRIVLHHLDDVPNGDAQDLTLAPTPCRSR